MAGFVVEVVEIGVERLETLIDRGEIKAQSSVVCIYRATRLRGRAGSGPAATNAGAPR